MKAATCPHCGSQTYADMGIVIEDPTEGRVSVQGVSLVLPRRQLLALHTLLRHAPRWVPKETLYEGMYGVLEDGGPDVGTMEHHISKLRSKLKPHGVGISNTRHLGYGLKRA